MTDHPVKRKLRSEILPYLISARKLRRQWFYFLHGMFGYTTDFLVALAGIGLSTPLLSLLAGTTPEGASTGPSLADALARLPHWLYYPVGATVVVWVLLRVFFNREEGQKRAVLARSCHKTLRQAEARLHRLLLKPDPMPELTVLVDESIAPTVDRNIQEESWPWAGPAPALDGAVEDELARLCARYEAHWQPVPATAFRAGGPDAQA